MRIRNIFRADRVVGPYYAFKDNVENFELSQASWEKTGKTEGEFWSVQGGPEGNRTPSGPQISNMNSCVVKSDFYTTSAQYSGLAANAVVDLYELTAYAICAFSVFFGGVDICVALLYLSSLKKPRKEEPTAGQYAEPVGEETVGE